MLAGKAKKLYLCRLNITRVGASLRLASKCVAADLVLFGVFVSGITTQQPFKQASASVCVRPSCPGWHGPVVYII